VKFCGKFNLSEGCCCTILAAETFAANGLKKILIPGIGYGRNAYPFLNNGMTVTGIEISETVSRLAENYFDHRLKIYHG
jgi:hypothetical protein